jgi:hypothetical protein
MRPLLVLAALGTVLSVNSAVAEHTPVLPDAPVPRHHSHTDEQSSADAENKEDTARKPATAPQVAPPTPAPVVPTVQAVPPGPPQKSLTGDEFQLIHSGSTAKEVMAVLGPPSSRIVIPDDDDHLRETLQYWVKGAPAATIRLDNGRVVKVETKPR